MKNLKLVLYVFALILLYCQAIGQVGGAGGLMIEIDKNIDVSAIGDFDVFQGEEDKLTFFNQSGESVKEINLPSGTLKPIFEMANLDRGPVIFSQDCFFFGLLDESSYKLTGTTLTKGLNSEAKIGHIGKFIPNFIDSSFAKLIYNYDEYIHLLINGWTTELDGAHPYLSKKGKLPPEKMEELLNSNQPDYIQLTKKYPTPPYCIGFIKFKAISSSVPTNILDIEIEVRPWFIVNTWDREFNILKNQDEELALMPYQGIKIDLEKNWTAYRQLKAIDEISSIIEAYVILKSFRKQKRKEWKDIYRMIPTSNRNVNYTKKLEPELVEVALPNCKWKCKVIEIIGKKVNKEESELALALLFNELRLKKQDTCKCQIGESLKLEWLKSLGNQAKNNKFLFGKLQFFRMIQEKQETPHIFLEDFLKNIPPKNKLAFRLRAQGIYWTRLKYLTNKYPHVNSSKNTKLSFLVNSEELKLIYDFNNQITKQVEDNNSNSINQLFIDLYEGRLLQIACNTFPKDKSSSNYQPFKEFIENIGKLHQLSAEKKEFKTTEEKMILHAHYRFMTFLCGKFPEIPALKENLEFIDNKLKGIG